MKRFCATLLVLVLASFSPALSVDCTEFCEVTPLAVHSSDVQGKKLTVGILNPTSEAHSGYIRGVVQSGGEEIYFYGAITAGPNGVSLFKTTFDHPINVLSCLTVCDNPPPEGPRAANEGPDPIAREFEGGAPVGGQGGGGS